jgi:excisionase family DNA binding protein
MYHDLRPSPLGEDLLYGAAAIAEYLRISRRKVFYLLEQGRIPAGKLGREYVASRAALRTHFANLAHGPSTEQENR